MYSREEEFRRMVLQERVDEVFTNGTELAARQYLDYNIKVYSLHGFFVEIWYLPLKNKIDKVEIVDINKVSALYIDDINISDLFNK